MVMDFDFTLLGEVPAPKSFMVRREFRGVGSFKLTVQRDAGGLLARDRVIYRPDRPEQGWIIHRVSRSGDTLTVDGTRERVVLIASPAGGMEIEETAKARVAGRTTSSATICSPATRRAPTCTSQPTT